MTPWQVEVCALDADECSDAALDVLFWSCDSLASEAKFTELDQAVSGFDLETLSIGLLVGLLSITLASRDHLPSRPKLVADVEAILKRRDPERLEALMKGLR